MKYNITKMLIANWGLENYKALPLHYKIYLRRNYKTTIIRRFKNNQTAEGVKL